MMTILLIAIGVAIGEYRMTDCTFTSILHVGIPHLLMMDYDDGVYFHPWPIAGACGNSLPWDDVCSLRTAPSLHVGFFMALG